MSGTKFCNSCKTMRQLSDFYKNSCRYDGVQSRCKFCQSKSHKKYYQLNKKKYQESHAEYYKKNRATIREKTNLYRKEHPHILTDEEKKAMREHNRKRYLNRTDAQKEKDRINRREYQRKNKDRVHEWQKSYRENHKDQIRNAAKEYRKNNREKIAQAHLDRLHRDPVYKLKEQSRNMIRCAFRSYGHRKTSLTKEIVGCDLDALTDHLKKTWKDRYGTEWNGQPCHIDHIVPLATAKNKSDIVRLCHYSNLQLMTPDDNRKKGATTLY